MSGTEEGTANGTDADDSLTEPRWRRFREWVLISGNRRVVAVGLLLFVVTTLLVTESIRPVELDRLLSEETTVQGLFQTLLSGIILLVSIVVSINSLVVSQELTPIGSQHERIIESWNFREQTAETIGSDVAPAVPDEFLQQLLDAINEEVETLIGVVERGELEDRERFERFTDRTTRYLEETEKLLQSAAVGSFNTRLFGPTHDPAGQLEEVRNLRRRSRLPADIDESLEKLVSTLQYYLTAREYFKTIHYKREFSKLSRDLLYTGLPAILLMSYVILAIDAQSFPGATFGVDHLFLFFTLAFAVALSPFLVLTSYVLRVALIAENTITAGAFLLD